MPAVPAGAFNSINVGILQQQKVDVIIIVDTSSFLDMRRNNHFAHFMAGKMPRRDPIYRDVASYAVLLSSTVQLELVAHVNGSCRNKSCRSRPNNLALHMARSNVCSSISDHEKAKELHDWSLKVLAYFGLSPNLPPPTPAHVILISQTHHEESELLRPLLQSLGRIITMSRDAKIVMAAVYLTQFFADSGNLFAVWVSSNDKLERILCHLNYMTSFNFLETMNILG